MSTVSVLYGNTEALHGTYPFDYTWPDSYLVLTLVKVNDPIGKHTTVVKVILIIIMVIFAGELHNM